VNLVHADAAEEFARQVASQYEEETGVKPEVYVCAASAGAGELVLA
jgi:galactokinase